MVLIFVYNFAMAVVDAVAIWLLRRRLGLGAWFCVILGVAMLAVLLAVFIGLTGFRISLLLTYGVFLHGPLVLLIASVLLWRRHRRLAYGSIVLVIFLGAVAFDAFMIEPTWLEVTHLKITDPKLKKPLRLVVLADLQTDQFGSYEQDVLRRALQENPDVILLAGDYLPLPHPKFGEVAAQYNAFLHEIGFQSSYGIYAVRGNVDRTGWPTIFKGLPVTAVDRTGSFEVDGIWLTCLSLAASFNPKLVVERPDEERFHVVLGHAPDYALGQIDADLLIAGHTHGGQVRLPGIGPLITLSRVPRRWVAGVTELGEGRHLVVSRGIGMERGKAPQLRFYCRPELVVIDLVPSPDGANNSEATGRDAASLQ